MRNPPSLVSAALIAGATLIFADAALAAAVATPAPIAGVGVGAVVLLGAAYRVLKRRGDR